MSISDSAPQTRHGKTPSYTASIAASARPTRSTFSMLSISASRVRPALRSTRGPTDRRILDRAREVTADT
jgi:hypothetical protein